jgi:hypothetical protein
MMRTHPSLRAPTLHPTEGAFAFVVVLAFVVERSENKNNCKSKSKKLG